MGAGCQVWVRLEEAAASQAWREFWEAGRWSAAAAAAGRSKCETLSWMKLLQSAVLVAQGGQASLEGNDTLLGLTKKKLSHVTEGLSDT